VDLYERLEKPQSLGAGFLPQAIGESIVDAITYIRDSGILHALLNLSTYDGLLGHPVSGNSWEGFVIENILSICLRHVDAYFYRTATGNEIDLLLSYADELMAVQIKRSTAPKLTKGFHIACDDVNPTSKWVVHLGDDEYKRTLFIRNTNNTEQLFISKPASPFPLLHRGSPEGRLSVRLSCDCRYVASKT
jgi:hypothetical protein